MVYNVYNDFTTDVKSALERAKGLVQDAIEWVCDKWNDAVNSWKMNVVPGFAYLVHRALDKLEDAFHAIWNGFKDVCKKVWTEVDKLAGGPFELMNMSDKYIDATSTLRDESALLTKMKSRISDHWDGEAKIAFGHVVDEQLAAMTAMDKVLTTAQQACAKGAKQIRDVWTQLIHRLLEFAGGIADSIKESTNVGQWVTLDTGPALKLYSTIGISVAQITTDLKSFFDENATVNEAMWRDLNANHVGLLNGNRWPSVDPYYGQDLGSKSAWDPVVSR